MESWRTEQTKNAMGGTELMMTFLDNNIPPELLSKFQIIPGRVAELDESKVRLLYCHDLPQDATPHLKDGGWAKFHRIVCVSHWQQQAYINTFGIPWHKTVVMQNAIKPIETTEKPEEIRIIYHTTPHRGLNILLPVFAKLAEEFPNLLHLDVYSSFKLYGWEERDKDFKALFQQAQDHPAVSYHGSVPNDEIRQALAKSHIFAYPSIWPETSCICLMEAMSAGLICVHPNFAALPETAANLTWMYNWHEDQNQHAQTFYAMLKVAITKLQNKEHVMVTSMAKDYADLFYSYEYRVPQWINFLKTIENEPTEMPKGPVFHYRTN